MPILRALLTLEEPFTCSSNPVVSNEIHTVDHIPATILRGALYTALMRAGRGGEVDAWLGVSDQPIRYSPAWPLAKGSMTVPMPLSFVNDKGDSGLGGKCGVLNLLWFDGQTLPEMKDGHRFQWTRPAKHWLVVDATSNPVAGYSVEAETHMHVGLHYERQASRQGALFSQSVIPAGAQFGFWIDDPAGSLKNLPFTAYLGKRRSAGNGEATLRLDPAGGASQKGTAAKGEYLVHFLSDCLVASEHGGWEVGLGAEGWGRLLGVEAARLKVIGRSAHRQVFGWSNMWGRPREPVTAIAAGSVFRITAADDVAKRFAALETNGLGARTEEGFGWIAVNPRWLFRGSDAKAFGKGPDGSSPVVGQNPLVWPGLEAIPREVARGLVGIARAVGAVQESRKLAELASLAARSNEVEKIVEYVAEMAGRHHARGWDKVQESLRTHGVLGIDDIGRLRFVLSSAATLSRREEAQ
jgi:hypothetical protein